MEVIQDQDQEPDPFALFMCIDQWQYQDQDQGQDQDQEVASQSSNESYILGFVIADIVGLQCYSGTISGREKVCLVREPLNPYDNNAIKVLNTRTVQVGYVEGSVAAVLAPLIDSRMIFVEGIVLNTLSRVNMSRIPCQVHIFTRLEMLSNVKDQILQGGLQFFCDNDASIGLSEAVIVEERKEGSGVKSVDEIFKLVDKNVKKNEKMEAMEPPKEVIKSELFAHQKEGLGWLVRRESSEELPPFWEEKDGEFVNVLTNHHTDKRPEPLRGGIFADDMGLGKTLTLLSLIAFDKCAGVAPGSIGTNSLDVNEVEDKDTSASSYKKCKRFNLSNKGSGRGETSNIGTDDKVKGKSVGMVDKSSSFKGKKMTLIVFPPSVFSTWITQLEEHTIPGILKTYIYYGERTQDVEELKKYDLVLTTYSTLGAEEVRLESPMKKIEWWRVILDEAHMIKNPNAQQSLAVTNLNAKRRWVVTGTPIQNGTFDLFSLMAFLQFEPFSIQSYWQSLVQCPLAQGDKKGLSRLQVLMSTISLRRTKDKSLIGLPPKTIERYYVELSVRERKLYDELEGNAKGVVREYLNSGSRLYNYSTVLSILLRLRQICTNLALCPSDVRSILPSNTIEDVSNNPKLLKKLVAVLQDGEDFDCPICITPPSDITITSCAHIFCRSCILKTLQFTKPCCPLCRNPLSQSDLFSSPPESSDTDITTTGKSSSKVSALLTLLLQLRDQNPTIKSVVFSQFRKMLILLEDPLKAAGFRFLRLDGSMNAKRRAQVIKEFGNTGPGRPTVLLASLRASGAGINLTAASRVFLLEPWWNPAIEEQAMDRVHRIGQKEEVKIVRLIVRNSIEERILELQDRKKNLARESFRRKGKDQREVNADDMRFLMSL